MAAFGSAKEIMKKSMDMTKGGGSSRDYGGDSAEDRGSGPTGSSRSYPKGGGLPATTQDAPFNPQKVAATDLYVGGVD